MPRPPKAATPNDHVGPVRILPGPVEVVHLKFDRVERNAETKLTDEIQVTFGVGARRLDRDEVVVQLEVAVEKAGEATIAVTARSLLRIEVLQEAPLDLDVELARIASQVGPVVIYPYLREVVADLSRRGGITPITLPVYQIGKMFTFDPENLALPENTGAKVQEKKAKPQQRAKKK